MIFSCRDISLSFGAQNVLRDVGFDLKDKEKTALVGVNGAGKSSIFKVILGQIPADGGTMALAKGARIGHLSQEMDLNPKNTISQEMLSVFDHLAKLEEEIRLAEIEMAELSGNALEKFMEKYSRMVQNFEQNGGYEYKSRARGVASGLGFTSAEHDLPISMLSGGQKTRVGLGKLLLTQPELLLLDEPTNHLDIRAIGWLEEYFLREYHGCVLIISHDRFFLDKVVKKVIEVEHGITKSYKGNYSAFVEQKAKNFEIEQRHFDNQQQEIKRMQASIDLLRAFGREKHIKRARSKEKMLAKVERVDAPKSAPSPMRLALAPKTQSGNDVLKVVDGRKAFGDITLFRNAQLDIKRGEAVALIGENGVGKTTLFKMILEGAEGITLGSNVKIGYYDQTLDFEDKDKTIFMEISDAHPRMKNQEIRSALAAFLFVGDDVFKPISALSGGEKGRVALAKLMLSDINFLMLDEPTNHLDLFSKEILEGAINSYDGTVLYISHDRYFINNTADKIYELKPDKTTVYLGNYDYYMEKTAEPSAVAANQVNDSDNKQAYLNQKEQQAKERQLKAKIERLEKAIEETEMAIMEQDGILFQSDVATDPAKAQEVYLMKAALEAKLENLIEEWEEAMKDGF
ncbi:MAG: ABC-F family ATP-binding cassette domain-containing protein [Defluviitaleaceae bacterium]|nr:ABC-F family ATP-binding cassette domain-containing protein [Defluviitaleaceae bacterium]